MASIGDEVFDEGLDKLDTDADRIDICSQEPTSYAEATSTYTLGNKTSPTVSAPADRGGGGREVTVSAIADGSVTDNGTATHIAIVDTVNSLLLATAALASSQAMTSGNTWTLTQFTVGIPDPA